MKLKLLLALLPLVLIFTDSCGRFSNQATKAGEERYVVISPIYNEIIWALGAQDKVVGVDLSSTYPPEVKNVQTVGYHRALSAEGILSLRPTQILSSDDNIGPPQVVEQPLRRRRVVEDRAHPRGAGRLVQEPREPLADRGQPGQEVPVDHAVAGHELRRVQVPALVEAVLERVAHVGGVAAPRAVDRGPVLGLLRVGERAAVGRDRHLREVDLLVLVVESFDLFADERAGGPSSGIGQGR